MHTAADRQTPGASPAAVEQSADTLLEQVDQLKHQLREAQKLASLGTTSAMLAHEYNNVLAPVVSYAQYALDRDDVPMMRKTLHMMLKQFAAVQAMSDRVLGLARRTPPQLAPARLRQVIEDALMCLGRDPAKDHISVVLDVDESIQVCGHQQQLQQVIFNLLINARQAMIGRHGVLSVRARPGPNNHVVVQLQDNGRGIEANHLEHIFDPFFTTKQGEPTAECRGVGLGLSISREIVEAHGGSIEAHSKVGHGTTFSISLPRHVPEDGNSGI